MKAGRELDTLVTEKIFGMEPSKGDGYHRKSRKDAWQIVPHYSTDIGAAWHVVEHMRANVPDYRALRMESVPLGYTVAFYSHKNRLDRIGAFVAAETAPLAICRAALAAMEGK